MLAFKNPVRVVALLSAVSLLAGRTPAQNFRVLHNFSAGSDGSNPHCTLALSDNVLYGTAAGGGAGYGTVFAVKTDGTSFTNIFSFAGGDGNTPMAGLFLASNVLYGTTRNGGVADNGTVFSVQIDGTGFTNLHSFTATPAYYPYTNSDGSQPSTALILRSSTLYGTAQYGGTSANGTIFQVNTDGTGFTTLHSFATAPAPALLTNSDGIGPVGSLIMSDTTLYGTTHYGGSSGAGTVFSYSTTGAAFSSLYTFTSASFQTNTDGASPEDALVSSGDSLYGTAPYGGSCGHGTVFKLKTNGTGLTVVHTFTAFTEPSGSTRINNDGAYPVGGLTLSGNTLYGTTRSGGSLGSGTVFSIKTDGTAFSVLHNFNGLSGGSLPVASLIFSENTLYGTTFYGGTYSNGIVFSLFILPQLSINSDGPNVILSWPTNYNNFTLQSTTNLTSPLWTTNFPAPAMVNGQNTVTNPISSPRQFFRLSQLLN